MLLSDPAFVHYLVLCRWMKNFMIFNVTLKPFKTESLILNPVLHNGSKFLSALHRHTTSTQSLGIAAQLCFTKNATYHFLSANIAEKGNYYSGRDGFHVCRSVSLAQHWK